MKKRLLSNRVRNAILMAILLQSVIFGFGLMVTGTFSGTANRPVSYTHLTLPTILLV